MEERVDDTCYLYGGGNNGALLPTIRYEVSQNNDQFFTRHGRQVAKTRLRGLTKRQKVWGKSLCECGVVVLGRNTQGRMIAENGDLVILKRFSSFGPPNYIGETWSSYEYGVWRWRKKGPEG